MKISRDNTHKKNIIDNIFNTSGVPSSFAAKLVDDLILIMISNIYSKKELKIKNFGTFSLKKKKKRIGRNPKNKTIHEILERNVITFKTSTKLNKIINKDVKK
jgi:integration host factor subunit alpha